MVKKLSIQERFERNSLRMPNGCRCWTGDNVNGYGRMQIARKNKLVHRVAWEEEHGPIPDGMEVLHSCDTPACFEVSHLFIGTHLDNMRDMSAKGRAGTKGAHPGQAHHFAVLSDNDVAEIRRLAAFGQTSIQLAKRYPVNARQIRRIIQGTSR